MLLLFLLLMLLGEYALFHTESNEFLTSDGFYYLVRPLEKWNDWATRFTRLDERDNYRPLTYVVATGLVGIGQSHLTFYHLAGLWFHMLNSLLVFWLCRLVLRSNWAGLAAAAIFGFHRTASQISFGITFLPDQCYVAFFLLALILLFYYQKKQQKGYYLAGFLAFLFSLLSKEPAMVFAPVLFLFGFAWMPATLSFSHRLRLAFRQTIPFFLVTILYLVWFGFLSHWKYVPQNTQHPYHLSLDSQTLASKIRYLKWAFNIRGYHDVILDHPSIAATVDRIFPETASIRIKSLSDYFMFLMGPIWLLWLMARGKWAVMETIWQEALLTPALTACALGLAFFVIRRMRQKDWMVAGGSALFALPLLPVLITPSSKTMLHNLYLPVFGIAFLSAYWISRRSFEKSRLVRFMVVAIPITLALGGMNITMDLVERDWTFTTARQSRQYLADIQNMFPQLPKGSTLFLEKTGNPEWPWLLEGGNIVRFFYDDPNLKVLFGDYGYTLNFSICRNNVVCVREQGGRLVQSKCECPILAHR